MSRFLDRKYAGLESYTPGEQPKDKVFTKLNTNESPYPPGPAVIAAVNESEVKRLNLYSDPALWDLKSAMAKLKNLRTENVYFSNGSDDILNFAFMAFAENGKVSFPEISYGFYQVFADLYRLEAERIPLKDDFSIDWEDYMNKDNLIVIANPNAPTGKALTIDQIEEIVKSNANHVVVIDEAYVDFGADSAVGLIDKYENLLVVQTFSKSRSMAGARLGFAFACSQLIEDLEKIKFSTNPYNVNRITSAAGVAALSENDYYMDNCKKIVKNRENTIKVLRSMGFDVVDSKANFVFAKWPRIDGGALYEKLKEKGILIRHWNDEKISQYSRITIGTDEEMEILFRALREIEAEMQ